MMTELMKSFIKKADFVVRKAVARLRFEVAQSEIFQQDLPPLCLPRPCPTPQQRAASAQEIGDLVKLDQLDQESRLMLERLRSQIIELAGLRP